MKVTGVILAAGLGTRLRPSTDHCPKPLIPVGGIEPLFFALQRFHKIGIRRVVVNAHHLAGRISQALESWKPLLPGMECRISVEQPEILGTGGGLFKMLREHRDWFSEGGLLLQNGDTLANIPLERMLEKPNVTRFGISLVPEHLKKYKPLWIDRSGRWVGIGPDSPQADARPAHFLGVHYLSPGALAHFEGREARDESMDLFNGFYRPLADAGFDLESCQFLESNANGDFWFDMNTPEFLLEAQQYVLASLVGSSIWQRVLQARYPKIREVESGVWVLSGAKSGGRVYRAPVVMIESPEGADECVAGPITLGPHASLVFTRGAVRSSAAKDPIEIRNAVVMVDSGKDAQIPAKVLNEIRVI